MKLHGMGEFALIRHLAAGLSTKDHSVLLGIGDDAAVIKLAEQKYLLLTCDMLVDGTHFRKECITPQQLGHKALAVSFSDIAAMGGTPRYALVSAGWPAELELAYAEGIYEGMAGLAADYGVSIVGGDTVSAAQLILDVTVVGEMEEQPVTRAGAKTGHLFAVTGLLGASAAGLALLRAEEWEPDIKQAKKISQQETCPGRYLPEVSRQNLIRSHLLPQPRVREARKLLQTGRPSAMIDISDGLASEVHHICESSGVGAEIYLSRLPVHEDAMRAGDYLGEDCLGWALRGGEDYELLVTLSEDDVYAVQMALHQFGLHFSIIGKVVHKKRGVKLFLEEGISIDLTKEGYNHFSL